MDNKNILESIKKYIQVKKQEGEKQRRLTRFEYALKELNIEKINEYLNDGISIEEFEKGNSTLRKVLQGYEDYLFDIIENYRRKNTKMKNWDFFSKYCKMSTNDIPDEIKDQIKLKNKEVINLLEVLYQRGANINHNTYLGSPDSIIDDLRDKKEIHKAVSVMQVVYGISTISKEQSLIDWILEKEELVLEPRVIEQAVYDNNPDSVDMLEKLMKRGFRAEVKDFSIIGFNQKIPLLVEIIVCEDIVKAKEKFNVLWKYATEEEKIDFIENYDLDKFDIPNNNYSSSGLKM